MAFLAASLLINPSAVAQDNQSLELGVGSESGIGDGPVTTVIIPLLHNYNNPDDNVFTDFYPLTTATITITSLYSYNQSTGTGNPSIVMGWNVIDPDDEDDGDDGDATGASTDIVVPFTALDESIDDPEFPGSNAYSIAEMEQFYSSTINTIGDDPEGGINFTENRGVYISAAFEGLRDADLDYQIDGVGQRHEIGTMTIVFNRPIDNPILHFFGLGGFWELEGGIAPNDFKYINSGTVEFDFVPGESSASITGLNILSANPGLIESEFDENFDCVVTGDVVNEYGLDIVGNSIINTWNIPDVINTVDSNCDDAGVANGSVQFEGEGVETITLTLFARAVNDIDPFAELFEDEFICEDFNSCYAGTNEFGWGGGTTDPNNTEDPDFEIPPYNIAHDLFILSVSSDVDSDDYELTEGDSYRMFSSPLTMYEVVNGETDPNSQRTLTYNELIGELWTQGVNDPSYDTEFGDPNIFTWPLGSDYDDTADPDDLPWEPVPDLNAQITPGHGFLMTVFEFDDYETETGSFPKNFSFTGSEWPSPVTVSDGAGDPQGWMLLGNPFKDPLNVAELFNHTTNTADVVYVWDRGTETAPDKGWRWAGTDPGGTTLGEIDNGVLMPFQGFFIQKTDNTATVEFNEAARDVGASGTFYRKELPTNSIRLFVEGESVGNSLWFTFSDQGSFDKLSNDALELESLNEHFAYLSTTKFDGVLLTASHLPMPDEDFEIPVNVQTTRPGMYTISATDFNLSLAQDLYLVDLHEDVSVRIDENFSYRFDINQAAKANPKPISGMINGPKKVTAEFGDRFLITTQPREADSTLPDAVALNQNYPNPFNPSTQITYELPQQTDVRLTVYDMVGRQVATLVNETVQAGVHNVNFDASSLSSGVYIYRLQAGSSTLSRKLTVIK